MTQKLFAFAKGKCCAESCDNPMFQEVLLAGHLYQNVLKVHLAYCLIVNIFVIRMNCRMSSVCLIFTIYGTGIGGTDVKEQACLVSGLQK